MNYRFQNLLGAPYRGGNVVLVNNSLLISPVGNRVSVTDLNKFQTHALPCQSSTNICRIAASPDGVFLIAIDEKNRCLFINLRREVIPRRITFKHAVAAAKFSPDGKLIAVAAGKLIQIWGSPGFNEIFVPFEFITTFSDCHDKITALDWSPDSEFILAGSKDLTVRLFFLEKMSKTFRKPFLFSGHKDVIVGCFFVVDYNKDSKVCRVLTISRDGAVFSWGYDSESPRFDGGGLDVSEPESPGTPVQKENGNNGGKPTSRKRKDFDGKFGALDEQDGVSLHTLDWKLLKKDYLMQAPAKVTVCDYHKSRNLLVVGFSNGVFGLYQMPDFVCLHFLSVSKEKITTAVFNDRGDSLALGCAKLGQLLVWEWSAQSQSLMEQGHYFDVNCMAYSPDSQFLATGADDNKVKVWIVSSGRCFITISMHTNAVTALHFINNNCLLSASLDGTVLAWDLSKHRPFKTFTTPVSRQLVSLAADQSGEVICAGTLDSFEIYVWYMKTGRLMDILSGHEGPVHGLMFSPTNSILASSSWDKTVRLWDVYKGKGGIETFPHTHDVLTVVYRPDGKQLACSTLEGNIHFWDTLEGSLMYTIEGRRDIAGGRLMTDRKSAANSTAGKFFTTLCYSADGSYILAGGSSKYICMYDVADQVLLHRYQITHNLSMDGVLDFLNSKNMTQSGPLELIDDSDSDVEEGVDRQTQNKLMYDLPGSTSNRSRPVIRTKCLRIAPTERNWAAATTEGVLIYTLDDTFIFDPTDLDIDVTPEEINSALEEDQVGRALILSLRLNEDSLIKKCIMAASPDTIPVVASSVPFRHHKRLFEALSDLLEKCPGLEFTLLWCQELCKVHGPIIQKNNQGLLPALKSLQKAMSSLHRDLADICSSNEYMLQYLCKQHENDNPLLLRQ